MNCLLLGLPGASFSPTCTHPDRTRWFVLDVRLKLDDCSKTHQRGILHIVVGNFAIQNETGGTIIQSTDLGEHSHVTVCRLVADTCRVGYTCVLSIIRGVKILKKYRHHGQLPSHAQKRFTSPKVH